MKNFITYFLIGAFSIFISAIGYYLSLGDVDDGKLWIFVILAVVLTACGSTYVAYANDRSFKEEIDDLKKALKFSLHPENAKSLIVDLLNILADDLPAGETHCRACIFRHDEDAEELYMWIHSEHMQPEERKLRFKKFQGLAGHIYWHDEIDAENFLLVDMKDIDPQLTFKLNQSQIDITNHVKTMIGIPIILDNEELILIIDSPKLSDESGLLDEKFDKKAKKFKNIIQEMLSEQAE